MEKMNLQDLDKVNGGFEEQNGNLPTAGMEIVCPNCHKKDQNAFAKSVLFDPEIGSVEYRCSCGCRFVCFKGKVILRKDWDDLCAKHGIKYVF